VKSRIADVLYRQLNDRFTDAIVKDRSSRVNVIAVVSIFTSIIFIAICFSAFFFLLFFFLSFFFFSGKRNLYTQISVCARRPAIEM